MKELEQGYQFTKDQLAELDALRNEVERLRTSPEESRCAGLNVSERHIIGITLRDYFAARAMQGQIAGIEGLATNDRSVGIVAALAYAVADAMIKAREA